MKIFYLHHPCPVGELLIVSNDQAITAVHITHGKYVPAVESGWTPARFHPVLKQAQRELDDYFNGRLQSFGVAIDPVGTTFQKSAWAALTQIPFGETRTYAEQAVAIGRPRATRAVGAANGKNPISIIVPCHRVIGRDGSMTGFAGGLDAKRTLLGLEARHRTASGQFSGLF